MSKQLKSYVEISDENLLQSGFSLHDAIEKQIPMKPHYSDEWHCYCGNCNKRLSLKHKPNYCMRCGQKVKL